MELRQMRYFLAVLDHGGITRAARELYISQPSLSQAIRTLESQFDTQLFQRVGRELRPTADGLALAEQIRRVLALVDDATDRVREVTALRAGRLNISAVASYAISPLPQLIAAFLERYPRISVRISDVGTTAAALALLKSAEADVALVELPVSDNSLITQPLRSEELLLAGTVGAMRRYTTTIPASAIARVPMGIVSRDEGGYTPSMRRMATLMQSVRATCGDREFLWELVRSSAVATFLPRHVAELVMPGVPLLHIDPPVIRQVGVAYRDGSPTPAQAAFLQLVAAWSRTEATKASATGER